MMWSVIGNLFLLLVLITILLDDVAIATVDSIPPFHSNADPLGSDQDEHGGIPVGVSSRECDDGKTNLTVDWDGSTDDFACLTQRWKSNRRTAAESDIQEVCTKKVDHPMHICMIHEIVYDDVIPTSGAHRPLWARYGEYRYLPKQRWLHNAEHGAAVLLYHPCADIGEVDRLKQIVTGCLRKHIITPYKELTRELPFAIVTYGCKLQLPYVDAGRVRAFLKKRVNKAPEHRVSADGQFDDQLILPAQTVSNDNDCQVCPKEAFEHCGSRGHSATGRVRQALAKAHHSHTSKSHKKHHRNSHTN